MARLFLALPLLTAQQPLPVATTSKVQPTHEPKSRQLLLCNAKQPNTNSSPTRPYQLSEVTYA